MTAFWVEKLDGLHAIPIGRPIDNIKLLVCNSQLRLVPQGVPGELLIGGVGLAHGYLNRPELTAEKFILNPYCDRNDAKRGERLYKTGDLVRWMVDGNLEYLGRIDQQVKIEGFRIEPGEIENTLSTHESVKDAVVVVRESAERDKHLVAYVVVEQGEVSSLVEGLRQYLHQRLPEYMVPSAFVVMDKLPLTPNGKVDRRALPEPDLSKQQSIFVAPRDEIEEGIAVIMANLLKLEKVGINDNFFHLGGHSLLANQVVSRINQQFEVNIAVRTLFEASTPLELSRIVNAILRISRTIYKIKQCRNLTIERKYSYDCVRVS